MVCGAAEFDEWWVGFFAGMWDLFLQRLSSSITVVWHN